MLSFHAINSKVLILYFSVKASTHSLSADVMACKQLLKLTVSVSLCFYLYPEVSKIGIFNYP